MLCHTIHSIFHIISIFPHFSLGTPASVAIEMPAGPSQDERQMEELTMLKEVFIPELTGWIISEI